MKQMHISCCDFQFGIFSQVGFQLIFCYRGWVEVVYEDQGAPFVLHAGDCVIQGPEPDLIG